MNKSNTSLVILVIGVVVVAIAAFFLFAREAEAPREGTAPEQEQSVPPKEGEEPVADTEVTQEGTVIAYTDSGFTPETVTVSAGETVTFRNESSRSVWPASAVHPTHTVYGGTALAQHCPDPDNTAFDSCGGVEPGGSWLFTFEQEGSWGYHDHLRASRTGTIEVRAE